MQKFLFVFLCVFFSCSGIAQDRHFSQFYAIPLELNPALTGAFDGKYRIGANFRDQWGQVLENPYRTFGASIEVKFGLDQVFKSQYKDKVAVGLQFFSDKINTINFNTTKMALSGAYHKALDTNSKQYLTLGVQGSLSQRNVTYGNFTFEDQFNGLNGYTLGSGEVLPANNFSFTDLSVGLNYSISPRRNLGFFLGGAIHHVTQPEISFYYNEELQNSPSNRLFRKYSAHASANIAFSNQFALIPKLLFATQGPHLEMNLGTNARVSISEYNGTALTFGAWARPVGYEDDSIALDALIFLIGLEHNGVLLGLSYDLNLDDLATYRQGQNAFELSIAYIGEYDSETILCPKF